VTRTGHLALRLALFSALGLGCSGGAEDAAAAASAEADARVIAEIVGTDPGPAVLDDVADAIDTDRPVMAADLLDEVGLPAMRRQVTRLEDAPMATSEGRTLRARTVRLYRARVTAYETYQRLLMRGVMAEEGEELLDALDAVSENERDLLALQRELAELAPIVHADEPDEEAALGGLPPVHRETPPPDDETPGDEPEGPEEDPARLEDALPEM
jgi:hypothetical protein